MFKEKLSSRETIKRTLRKEYQTFAHKYFKVLIDLDNIVPFYAMKDNFKELILEYVSVKYDSYVSPKGFINNKLAAYVEGLPTMFYIYDENEKDIDEKSFKEYTIVFDFSYKNLKSIFKNSENIVVIECSTLYERYFVKNKNKDEFLNNIDKYLKVLACYYYNFIEMGTPTRRNADRRAIFKNRFYKYLCSMYENAKIPYRHINDNDSRTNLLQIQLKDCHISISINTIRPKLLKDPIHRNISLSSLYSFIGDNGIKILLNTSDDIRKYTEYIPSQGLDIINSNQFHQTRVKEIPKNIIPKTIK